jgi:hypothetical protein
MVHIRHRQNTKTSTAIQTERKEEHRETEEEMEGPTSPGGLRNRLTHLNLYEHDDDDNSPYYHLLKYLLFLLKHPLYCTC